ncbi:MAG: hypothetical protein AAGF95_10220 [Chloroflexota bacterium]
MPITIRLVQTHDEYRAVERLQREAWGFGDAETVPGPLLLTAQKSGGLVLGAFDDGKEFGPQLVGFVFSFVGLAANGRIKHSSHMAAVAPAYQNRNLGYHLKLVQREHVLMQGITHITWTFDPLESRNAHLNLHKLGATCQTYLPNVYGDMRDAINAGLPTDRFQLDWFIASKHVEEHVHKTHQNTSLRTCQSENIPLLSPPQTPEALKGKCVLVEIPSDFQSIKKQDPDLAKQWRQHTREIFEAAFKKGYTVVDFIYEDGRSCYLLVKDWTPHAHQTSRVIPD